MRSPSWLSRKLLAIVLILSLLGIPSGLAAVRVCNEPLDISGTTKLPEWITNIKERDDVAYPTHAAVATVLNQFGCNPEAVGLQWLKAAYHARSNSEAEQAAQGIAAAKQRHYSIKNLEARLCEYIGDGYGRPMQESVLAKVGLKCDETSPSQ